MEHTMPFMRMPHDTMRNGLPGAKADVSHLGKHPVELIQNQVSAFCLFVRVCFFW